MKPKEVVVRSREGPLFDDDRVAKAIEQCARGGKVKLRPTIEFVKGPVLWDGDRVSFADAGRLYPHDGVAKTEKGPFWCVAERGDGWVRITPWYYDMDGKRQRMPGEFPFARQKADGVWVNWTFTFERKE